MPPSVTEPFRPNRALGVPLVLTAGIFWSTSGLVYRLIAEASPWQVLFYRSAALLGMLALWLGIRYRRRVVLAFSNAGLPGLIGGFCLGVAFTAYILALEYTTVANAMFILAAAPFITALLGRMLLGERIARHTWGCMTAAVIGLGIMTGEELSWGRGLGELFALLAALGFSGLTVSLRARHTVDMLPAIFLASCFATLFASLGILLKTESFHLLLLDTIYSSGMGLFQIGLGFLLYTAGARHLVAVELTLLSLTEIIAGPILVWVGLGETPTVSGLVGGALILTTIVTMALMGSIVAKKDRTYAHWRFEVIVKSIKNRTL